MRYYTALLCAALAGGAMSTVGAAPAVADVRGISVELDAPNNAEAGGNARTVTAVTSSELRQCRKVRFALIVRGGTVPVDGIQVVRFEDDGQFATQKTVEDNTATFVDEAVDPGTLCRNRTVTGRWRIGFTGEAGGTVQFEVQAFDAQNTLLSAAGAATEVAGTAETTEPSPEPTETTEPAEEETTEPAEEETSDDAVTPVEDETGDTGALEPASSETTSLLGPGLVVGGVCVCLGILLLLRLRSRTKEARRQAQSVPTGFYPMR
ncbi:hypothetical protein [Actinoplanes sp. NPDC051851]|uniref:hypothetical protein n=1 Tax=Actinoplanes sp. NPDC051851 TaxID=3154753 RepID=UPI0034127570